MPSYRQQPSLVDRLGAHGTIVACVVLLALLDAGLTSFGAPISLRSLALASWPLVQAGQAWRIFTASLLQPAADPISLAFTAYVMWWLVRTMTRYWPTARVVAFIVLSGATGVGLAVGCNALRLPFVDPGSFLGLMPVMEALGVGFSFLEPEATLLLAFVLPVRGYVFRWVGLGLTALEMVFRGYIPTASLGAWLFAYVWLHLYTSRGTPGGRGGGAARKAPNSHLRAVPRGPFAGTNKDLH